MPSSSSSFPPSPNAAEWLLLLLLRRHLALTAPPKRGSLEIGTDVVVVSEETSIGLLGREDRAIFDPRFGGGGSFPFFWSRPLTRADHRTAKGALLPPLLPFGKQVLDAKTALHCLSTVLLSFPPISESPKRDLGYSPVCVRAILFSSSHFLLFLFSSSTSEAPPSPPAGLGSRKTGGCHFLLLPPPASPTLPSSLSRVLISNIRALKGRRERGPPSYSHPCHTG